MAEAERFIPGLDDMAVMRRIDELHLEYPFAGSRMLRDLLRLEGYQDIELTDIKGSKGSKGQLDVTVRQQLLIVMLRDGLFDGFMWFSNDETATGWVKASLQGR